MLDCEYMEPKEGELISAEAFQVFRIILRNLVANFH